MALLQFLQQAVPDRRRQMLNIRGRQFVHFLSRNIIATEIAGIVELLGNVIALLFVLFILRLGVLEIGVHLRLQVLGELKGLLEVLGGRGGFLVAFAGYDRWVGGILRVSWWGCLYGLVLF